MSTVCHVCEGTDIEYDQARGDAVCTNCGSVLEDNIIVSEVTFAEHGGGGSSVIGQFVSSEHSKHHVSGSGFHHGMGRDSREITLQNAKKRIVDLGQRLRLNQHCIDSAFMFFKMALQMNLTRGRKSNIIDTACLYLVCRSEGTPHLLLDFSDVLQINVYALGRAFLKLSNALHINPPAIDPCLYIHRFAHKLELGDKTHEVSMTALRLVARMKRDWIHHGRRPSGLCGAALLVAARLHNFSRSVREVARVVKLSEGTIRKRLGDFRDTPSSRLTIDEFLKVDLEQEHDPPSYTESKKKAKAGVEVKDSTKAHPLVNTVKDTTIPHSDVSITVEDGEGVSCEGGVSGDEDEEEVEGGFGGIKMESVQDIIAKARFAESFLKGAPTLGLGESLDELAQLVDEPVTATKKPAGDSNGTDPLCVDDLTSDPMDGDDEDSQKTAKEEEETFDDLDDIELDEMILSTEEVEIKSRLWFAENGDFLKEQELRRQRQSQEKAEKEKQRKRHFKPRKSKASQQGLASNAGEAIERMLVEKKISSKINYEVLKDLADGFGAEPSEVNLVSNSGSSLKTEGSMQFDGSENGDGTSLPIARSTLVASGRLPSLNVRKRTFSSLEASPGLSRSAKFSRVQPGGAGLTANTKRSKAAKTVTLGQSPQLGKGPLELSSAGQTADLLTDVIATKLEHFTAPKVPSPTGDSVVGEGVPQVVEESGPVQYEGEEGLDDEEMEELVYEDDPLLQSDFEDDGDDYA